MRNIKQYRRRLRQEVETERTRRQKPQWGAMLESLGAPDILGRAQGGESDRIKLLSTAAGPEAHPAPEVRVAALGRATFAAPRETGHHAPLELLADEDEDWHVRIAALRLLKTLAFSSPTFPEWRPAYLEALRKAVGTPELRLLAFSTLTAMGDRRGQELLLEGLRDEGKALVPAADALNFLSKDPHVDVRDIARQIADDPPDARALEAAVRHLAGDPSSVERLKSVFNNIQNPASVRKTAATALNALGPEHLPNVEARSPSATDVGANDLVAEHVRNLALRHSRR